MNVEAADRSKFSFEAFAGEREYIDVNTQFVNRTIDVRPNARILDYGGGTGLIAKIARDRFNGIPATITIVDPNAISIQIARRNIPNIGATHINFIEGSFESLYQEIQPQSIDMAYFCNAIHEIHNTAEQRRILAGLFTVMKSGAKLGINSTFTKEWPTERKDLSDMGKLKKGSILKLGREVEKVESGFILHPTLYYVELLRDAGFTVDEATGIQTRKVSLYANAIRAIASYDGFIDGTFSDMAWADEVSTEDKSNALLATIDEMEQEAINAGEIFKFNRNWIEILAKKPGEAALEELPQTA